MAGIGGNGKAELAQPFPRHGDIDRRQNEMIQRMRR
jgi:hypothetical protein